MTTQPRSIRNTLPASVPAPPVKRLVPAIRVVAYAESQPALKLLARVRGDIALSRTHWQVRLGGLTHAIDAFRDQKSPDLLIIDCSEPPERLLDLLETLSEHCERNTRVLLLCGGQSYSAEFYRLVLKLGVSDLLMHPVDHTQVVDALKEIYRDWTDVRLGRMTAFIGSRGSGSSMVAQNVAAVISRTMSTDVLLVDMDPQFGTVGLNFNSKSSYSLTDALRRGSKLDDILIDRIATRVHDRLRLLTLEARTDHRSELPLNAIRAILDLPNVTRQHVVLDLPPLWSRRSQGIISRADHVVITAEPSLRGFRDAGHLVHAIRAVQTGRKDPALVINKVRPSRERHISTAEFQDFLRLEYVFEVPYNHRLVRKSQATGRPIIECDEGSAMARRLLKIAQNVNGDLDMGDERGFWRRVAFRLRKWW